MTRKQSITTNYYNISDDIRRYPDAWTIITVGGRGTGKTYSALLNCIKDKIKFVFVKRTIDDVKMLCGRGHISEYEIDLSPFKPINRDHNTNIKSRIITDKGLGGFWEHNKGNEPVGDAKGYIVALNAVSKVKGFDLSECDWMIFDEFIPQPWDRVNRKEGEQLLDLYKTVARDRELRGKPPLKLICLANAVNIINPVCQIFELTDKMVEMQIKDQEYYYNNGVLVHMLHTDEQFLKKEKSSVVYETLKNTAWGHMAYDNEFAYNDFSNINHISLKGYSPLCCIIYKMSEYYIYVKDGNYFVTSSRADKVPIYNLNRENDQKRFNLDYRIDIKDACIDNRVVFKSYVMYDLIMNYTDIFKL